VVSDDFTVRSITISELIGEDGGRYISVGAEGDPTPWDVLGMLEYAVEVARRDVWGMAEAAEDEP
jgi:hypothetical protein